MHDTSHIVLNTRLLMITRHESADYHVPAPWSEVLNPLRYSITLRPGRADHVTLNENGRAALWVANQAFRLKHCLLRLVARFRREAIDHCEGCRRALFIGDKGLTYDDGPTLCEACAPTYAESLEALREEAQRSTTDEEDRARYQASIARIEKAIASGAATADDKHVHDL